MNKEILQNKKITYNDTTGSVKMIVDIESAIILLKQKESTTCRTELIAVLERFGFTCKKRNSGNHWTYKHIQFTSIASTFDGGHGKDADIKCYGIKNARNALDALKEKIELNNDDD